MNIQASKLKSDINLPIDKIHKEITIAITNTDETINIFKIRFYNS